MPKRRQGSFSPGSKQAEQEQYRQAELNRLDQMRAERIHFEKEATLQKERQRAYEEEQKKRQRAVDEELERRYWEKWGHPYANVGPTQKERETYKFYASQPYTQYWDDSKQDRKRARSPAWKPKSRSKPQSRQRSKPQSRQRSKPQSKAKSMSPTKTCDRILSSENIINLKSFRMWSLRNHPDKGGDTTKFQEVSNCVTEKFR